MDPRYGAAARNPLAASSADPPLIWRADTSLDEKLHFSDSVLAGSLTAADKGYHLSRLTGDTSWSKGFEVGKGQSGQDALRHVMHIAAYSKKISSDAATPHGDFYHVVHPSMTTLVCSEALANADIEQDGIVWSKRFQEVRLSPFFVVAHMYDTLTHGDTLNLLLTACVFACRRGMRRISSTCW